MVKKKAISKKDAASFMDGSLKATAKGKKRKTDIEHDAELEDKMTAKTASKPRERQDTVDTKVSAGVLRGVVRETMARVYSEVWPSMTVENNGGVVTEIQEEAYITVNAMMFGTPHVEPRQALRMRELDAFGDGGDRCGDCA